MAYRGMLRCTAAVFVLVSATSPAFAQLTGDFYVHMELGWAGSTNANIHDRDQPAVNPLGTVTGITGTLSNLGSAWVAGVGGGMHIFPNIRGDIAYTYRGAFDLDEADQGVPTNQFKANIKSNSVMATGYWDFPVAPSIGGFFGFGI